MDTASILKSEIDRELNKLPEDKLREVLSFVEQLLNSKSEQPSYHEVSSLQPENDPILKFIGAASHSGLTQNIDDELYG
ncbi:MAG: hypothetical protein ETSY1_43295 [Candidatus Entotheonella factor]|uniref:DUF2281 domain-containing protein n=1 Tax=Entotheonella factor TaxID=1429438 RepID=W4L3N8_ENTF1|nr:MAG: hypothetical protein ETSY1_43295 [Candidatus Entotheonella factor]